MKTNIFIISSLILVQGVFSLSAKAIDAPPTRSVVQIAQTDKSAVTFYDRGVEKYKAEDFKGAIADFDRAIEIDPSYAQAFISRGNAKDDAGKPQEAIADYNKAIELIPTYADAYNNRGITKYRLGDKQAAISDYDKAIEYNPKYDNAYYNRGAS